MLAGEAVDYLAGGVENFDLDVGSVRGHSGGIGWIRKGGGGRRDFGGCTSDKGSEGEVIEDFAAVSSRYRVRELMS